MAFIPLPQGLSFWATLDPSQFLNSYLLPGASCRTSSHIESILPLIICRVGCRGTKGKNHSWGDSAAVSSCAFSFANRRKGLELDSSERGQRRKGHLPWSFSSLLPVPELPLPSSCLAPPRWLTTKWNPLESWLQQATWEGAVNSWRASDWSMTSEWRYLHMCSWARLCLLFLIFKLHPLPLLWVKVLFLVWTPREKVKLGLAWNTQSTQGKG